MKGKGMLNSPFRDIVVHYTISQKMFLYDTYSRYSVAILSPLFRQTRVCECSDRSPPPMRYSVPGIHYRVGGGQRRQSQILLQNTRWLSILWENGEGESPFLNVGRGRFE